MPGAPTVCQAGFSALSVQQGARGPSPLELASRWERQMTVEALQCHCQVQGQVLCTWMKRKQGPRGPGLILTSGPAGGEGVWTPVP